jgi:glycosyltransferase involved in cell wall biosynthesis
MRILMIATMPFFEPRGSPFHLYYRAQALSQLGHQVDLVTYGIGEDVVIPNVRLRRALPLPFVRRVKVGPSAAKFPLDVLVFFRALGLMVRHRYDCVNTHEEAGLFGAFFKGVFRRPYMHDMHSSLSEQLANSKFVRNRLLLRIAQRVERRILRSAGGVIVICPDMERTVREFAPGTPVTVIENTTVSALEAGNGRIPVRSAALRQELDLPEGAGPVLVYTGTFEAYQGLDLILDGMPAVLAVYPDARYLFVGGKPEQVARLRTRAEQLGVSHALRVVGQRPADEMPALMELADVLISPRSQGTNTPLKIYSYMHARRALLATNIRSHTQVLTPETALLVAPTAEALAEGTLRLLADPALRAMLAEQAQRVALERYSYEIYVQRTDEAYHRLIAPKPAGRSAVVLGPSKRIRGG